MNTLSQQEFEALFNNAAMGIITVNQPGDIIMINQFALQQFGYERDELLGRKVEMLMPERYKAIHVQNRVSYTSDKPYSRPMGTGLDLCGLRKDGTEFPVEISLSSYTLSDKIFSIAFISDVTVRNASERELLKLNNELEQKVEARTRLLSAALEKEKDLNELKSRFVSMASHEFRTPLSTILSSAYLVAQYATTEDQSKRDRHIQRIVSSVNMLTDILNDLLSVGRIEEGRMRIKPETIALASWMELVVGELRLAAKSGQTINYSHTGGTNILIDPTMLKHIIQNLVTNAVKFSAEGSRIDVQTVRHPETLTLTVADAGIGIPEKDQRYIFDRFFRATNVNHIQGTGLGLHIVVKYAELLNGIVTYESVQGQGTTFKVVFTAHNDKR